MVCYLGNNENRVVYRNFDLQNLGTNAMDYTHLLYERYLQNNRFIPPSDRTYWAHMKNDVLPQPPVGDAGKGLCNLFPLALDTEELSKTSSLNLGMFFSSKGGNGFKKKIFFSCATLSLCVCV